MAKLRPKAGKMSEVDTFYLQAHRNVKTPGELSRELGRTVGYIKKMLQELPPPPDTPPEPPKMATAGDLMARNEEYGTVVMTPAASEHGDSHRSGFSNLPPKTQKSVFIPNPNKPSK